MKTQSKKISPDVKTKSVNHRDLKHVLHKNRPLHKRFALHPANILFLLCVGVLLADFTFTAMADSYVVTGVVPAPPLTTPAVITTPPTGATTAVSAINVSGTCPNNSYVTLADNGSFVGSDICSSTGGFTIGLALASGTNVLTPQDYNVTNSPGPLSAPVTVTYIPPVSPPQPLPPSPSPSFTPSSTAPAATPLNLQILQVDVGVPYTLNPVTIPITSVEPTLSGIAPPFSRLTIVIHSNSYTCITTANAQGYWACTLPEMLSIGTHTVTVTATSPNGKSYRIPVFDIQTASNPPSSPQLSALSLTLTYMYRAYLVGQEVPYTINVQGGRAPYDLTVLWGDDSSTTLSQQKPGTFTIHHPYGWINELLGKKIVKIQLVDSAGNYRTLQLATLIRNPAFHSLIGTTTKSTGLPAIFNAVRPWLWLAWPGYTVAVLLVFSFWLGERQKEQELLAKLHRPNAHHAHGR